MKPLTSNNTTCKVIQKKWGKYQKVLQARAEGRNVGKVLQSEKDKRSRKSFLKTIIFKIFGLE
jgi:hypothetical protein